MIPKVPNPTYASDFRPIACCTIVYKIIPKILTHRMQGVIGEVINTSQAGFIPKNLIKGYTRKHVSPRCTIKIDLKKAYDSIEWPFYILFYLS